MKTREDRCKVLIKARLCCDGRWIDACIVNLSSRGVGLQAASPPPRGAFVEIRRGLHVIVAQVRWSHGHRFGVATQDPLAIDFFVRDSAQPPAPRPHAGVERRQAPRRPLGDTARQRGRQFEFAAVSLALAGGAVALAQTLFEQVGRPMASVAAALGGGG